MKVYLKGWSSEGLRCPDMTINFELTPDSKSVVLVQMPNGTGKTTIIELILAVLTNKQFNSSDVLALRKSQGLETGSFLLSLLVEDAGRPLREIELSYEFDFVEATAQIYTFREKSRGRERGFLPPEFIASFLTPSCAEVFVFKGDKAESLLNPQRSDAQAALDAFFGMEKIADLTSQIDKYFRDSIKGPATQRGETRAANRLDAWANRLAHLTDRRRALMGSHEAASRRVEEMREGVTAISNRGGPLKEKLFAVETEFEKAKSSVFVAAKDSLRLIRNPMFLAEPVEDKLRELPKHLDRLKLPGTSASFFTELVEQSTCICNRDMTPEAKAAIEKNASGLLTDEYISVVNGIKRDIETFSDEASVSRVGLEGGGKNALELLSDGIAQLDKRKQEIERIQEELRVGASAEDQQLLERYESAVGDMKTSEADLQQINQSSGERVESLQSKDPSDVFNLPDVERVLERLEQEVAAVTESRKLLQAKDKLQEILRSACQVASDKIAGEVRRQSNLKLERILPEGTGLQIKSIDRNIQIETNGRLQKSGSGAQNVAVAYSFATSVLYESGTVFPLIVDHPATALMASARRELGRIIPKMCDQFVGFVIDTETTGFVESLRDEVDDVDCFTVFRKIEGYQSYVEQAKLLGDIQCETDDCIVSTSRQFFDGFDITDQ